MPDPYSTPFLCSLVLLLSLCGSLAATEPELSYVDLANRLTDLEQSAHRSPGDGSKARRSSYDRKSRYDAVTGKYVDWGANQDGSGLIRKEGNQQVMAEMEGPASG